MKDFYKFKPSFSILQAQYIVLKEGSFLRYKSSQLIKKGVFMAKNKSNPLANYQSKRNFEKTPEPDGIIFGELKKPIFVVQRHDASHLHFDFRIESQGVLKSWALPKGLPEKIGERRLAIETEDHPIAYADFHGTIPKGNYGAGTVEIFDEGFYTNLKESTIEHAYRDGEITIQLHGSVLQDNYALIKTDYEPNSWIMIKMKKGK